MAYQSVNGLPKMVPTLFAIAPETAPSVRASKQALRAQAHALVPIRYSNIMFHPIMNAINSPTVT